MQSALEALLGEKVSGLSPNVISRLKKTWEKEYSDWAHNKIKGKWVYLWADGIYSHLRADESKLCLLVVIGVNERGEKHFLAIEDGLRESTQSWREVLLSLKERGLEEPPSLGVGDGALGFWSALSEIYPGTRQQRCWAHKSRNVLNYLPKSAQGKAKDHLHDIWRAESKEDALRAFSSFEHMFGPKYPKAIQCLTKDKEKLLSFYDFPAEHWVHIRTTNVIESAFSTIRHRIRQSKGCATRTTLLAMVYKLGMSAEGSWKRLRGFEHLAKVIEGVRFKDGIEVTGEVRDAA
jgi:transposase-like protein